MTMSVILSYTILVVFLSLIFILSSIFLVVKQRSWNNAFEDIDDMDSCPNTAKYFALYQGKYRTWQYGGIGGGCFGLILFFLLAVNNVFAKDKIGGDKIISLVLFSSITVGLIVYKLQNCSNSRICGQSSCIAPFFWSTGKSKSDEKNKDYT